MLKPLILVSLLLLALYMLSVFPGRLFHASSEPVPEFHVINNTSQAYMLRGYSDSAILMPAGSRLSFQEGPWLRNKLSLEYFIKKNMVQPPDAGMMGCTPIIRSAFDWGEINMPGDSGFRKIYFARINTQMNDPARHNKIFLIHFLWILKLFFFILMIELILGLYYTSLHYKVVYAILAMTLNFPVIYISADFGFYIRYRLDIFFALPKWALEPASSFISFSLPLGTILLLVALIMRKRTVHKELTHG